jgi:hypothetical protein
VFQNRALVSFYLFLKDYEHVNAIDNVLKLHIY